MNTHALRSLTIWSALVLTSVTLVFFIAAPVLGYPLTPEEGWRLAQINLPVFLGYLGTATQFVAAGGSRRGKAKAPPFMALLLGGPLVIYVAALVSLLGAFWWSNRLNAAPGSGISLDLLSGIFTGLLGVLAVSTNILVGLLFKQEQAKGKVA